MRWQLINRLGQEQLSAPLVTPGATSETFTVLYPDGREYQDEDLPLQHTIWTGELAPDQEMVLRYHDGRERVMLVRTAILGERGDTKEALTVLQDVTEMKQAQDALRESEERYRAFIAQSTEGIMRFETGVPIPVNTPEDEAIELFYKHSYLAECNDCMARMYGYERADDLVGARLGDFLIREDPNNIDYLRAFIRSGFRAVDAESRERDKEGREKYFANSLVGIVENGALVRAWGVQNDITERKMAEQQKDEFLSVASHELRTPLTIIRGYSKMALREAERSGHTGLARNLAIVEEKAGQMAHLIDEMLDVSRIESGVLPLDLTRFDLADLMQQVTRELGSVNGNCRLNLELSSTSAIVYADWNRLEQVLANLVDNAIKYSLKTEDSCQVHISLEVTEVDATISVRDYGVGIPESQRDQVFGRFFRASNVSSSQSAYPGLGLGLFISHGIITRHGGSMWLESAEGEGSTFSFKLPLVGAAPEDTQGMAE